MHSGLLTTDLHGKITSYNHAAELITGYQVSEVYGTDFQHIFQDITIPHIIQTLATLRKDAQRLETKITTKTGLPVHLGLSISSLRDDTGKIAGVICIFQDLTELKEMEDHIHRAERLAAIGQLAAGVAHEIRNPLASISGAIQMLQTELDLDEDNQALMQIIRRESKRLDAILTDFLLYARPQTITLAKCDIIHEVIVTVIGLLKQDEHCSQDTIQIQVNAPQNFPKIVCDAQQLKQVFWNIGLNALQAMPQGGTLTIDAALETVEPWELDTTGPIQAAVFAVSDTGPGIDADTQKNIFYPFYTTKPNGTGLGLAIAHQIIKNHHGSIRVKHSRPQGTTFEVVLPLTQEHW
jgi:two-component system sensor histidine kinase PilS (NtrC family)